MAEHEVMRAATRKGSIPYRVPDPPPALRDGVDAALAAIGASFDTADAPTFLEAARHLFIRRLRAGCAARAGALDLLVVDALVTYAFERASDDPASVLAQAERAMRELAALAEGGTSPARL